MTAQPTQPASPGEAPVHWQEDGAPRAACWRSAAGAPPPSHVEIADDRTSADAAYRLACEGTALLWRGDFQNARQLLQAMDRRIAGRSRRSGRARAEASPADAFHRYRQAQGLRAHILGSVLIPFDADFGIPLRRAPDVRQACREAYGDTPGPFVASLRELLGIVGAHEWRRRGVEIAALGGRIHPHYGVFAPVRGEYVALVADAPLPRGDTAFDVGTGTGVLAILLARRGCARVVATDRDPRALACARENVSRFALADRISVIDADLFPDGQASLIVCNPPWIPGRPASPLEHAVYDPDSRMLKGFLAGLAGHLAPGGEGWLVLSDIAEHLGLRTREDLLDWITRAGLRVVERRDTRPTHPRSRDPDDPLHAARAKETTSLWRLAAEA
ncbi:MAG: methyltransferase [Betaproteobacteria bacterium]|nr:methyltransferase [Betaproteobacteria bacterium]